MTDITFIVSESVALSKASDSEFERSALYEYESGTAEHTAYLYGSASF